MGFGMAMMSVMAVFRTAERVRLCAAAGLAIAAVSPVVSQISAAITPALLKSYTAPDYLFFGFFPWGAFLAFGMSAGSILRLLRKDQLDRAMQWGALLGFGLILAGRYCSDLPYSLYPKSEFWLDSPWLILIKLGVILLLLSVAYLWTQYGASPGWSWVRQFGTTSLLVYWVHTELVYGRWLYFWKNNLTSGQAFFAAAVVILLMLGLATAKTYRKDLWSLRLSFAYPFLSPRRVPGD
jgi:peptidoglycan/LPS O-acetylase OafA/YrhL